MPGHPLAAGYDLAASQLKGAPPLPDPLSRDLSGRQLGKILSADSRPEQYTKVGGLPEHPLAAGFGLAGGLLGAMGPVEERFAREARPAYPGGKLKQEVPLEGHDTTRKLRSAAPPLISASARKGETRAQAGTASAEPQPHAMAPPSAPLAQNLAITPAAGTSGAGRGGSPATQIFHALVEPVEFGRQHGRYTIAVRLQPESLGDVVLTLTAGPGETRLVIEAGSKYAAVLLEHDKHLLEDLLRRSGLGESGGGLTVTIREPPPADPPPSSYTPTHAGSDLLRSGAGSPQSGRQGFAQAQTPKVPAEAQGAKYDAQDAHAGGPGYRLGGRYV